MKYSNWRMPNGAPIVTIEELLEKTNNKYIVATSGGYDPVHPGHISCFQAARELNSVLVVIVNGDQFLATKKGKAFQDLKTRCQIVSAIAGVDYVVPFEITDDQTVNQALIDMRPFIFAKGGDRVDAETIPEWDVCSEHNIRVVTGVGDPKLHSSSDSLEQWVQFKNSQSAIGV